MFSYIFHLGGEFQDVICITLIFNIIFSIKIACIKDLGSLVSMFQQLAIKCNFYRNLDSFPTKFFKIHNEQEQDKYKYLKSVHLPYVTRIKEIFVY